MRHGFGVGGRTELEHELRLGGWWLTRQGPRANEERRQQDVSLLDALRDLRADLNVPRLAGGALGVHAERLRELFARHLLLRERDLVLLPAQRERSNAAPLQEVRALHLPPFP